MVGNALGPLGPGGVETGEFYSWCSYKTNDACNRTESITVSMIGL